MKPRIKRALVSLGLSVFFLVVYGGCETLAARRAKVPSFYFMWERRVPFIALEIIPYMSIDLFFITAPLLIQSNRELRTYTIRIIAAISVAAFFFVVFPLKFAFVRPATSGLIGLIFDQFHRADLPFNQLPSLHIALLLIVGDVFVRRSRGWLRIVLLIWFALIAASPLLVYQHHFIDLIAGLALGLICVNFHQDETIPLSFERNYRVSIYYAAGAIVAIAISFRMGRMSWPLWWPALAVALLSAGYCIVGPSIYGKCNGRLRWTARLLFWPTLLGQRASLHWYARRSRSYDAVSKTLWIGRQLSQKEAERAVASGVGAVIDLTCDFSEAAAFASIHYLPLPTLDLTAPTQGQIDEAIVFIKEHESNCIIYVHCKAGYSRSAVIAASYLLVNQDEISVEKSIDQIKQARPALIVRPEARNAMETFHRRLQLRNNQPASICEGRTEATSITTV